MKMRIAKKVPPNHIGHQQLSNQKKILATFWDVGYMTNLRRISCKNIFEFEREIFEKIEIFNFLHAKSVLLEVFFMI